MLATNARIDRPTPTSFIDRMAAGLRAYAQRKRDSVPGAGTPNAGFSELPTIAGRIDMLASYIGSLDVNDPRLFAHMQAASVLRDPDYPTEWRPGIEMMRVLGRLGSNGEFDPGHAFTELTAAAVEDVITSTRYSLARAESELGRLRAEVEELWPIKAELDAQKKRLGVGQMSKEIDMAAAARNARNQILAAAREEAANSSDSEDSKLSEELPTGVRPRGKGFQASAKVHGRQRQQTFATVDEASAQYERWVQERDQPVEAAA